MVFCGFVDFYLGDQEGLSLGSPDESRIVSIRPGSFAASGQGLG